MDTEFETEAHDMIRLAVWGGFDATDDLADRVMEWLEDEGQDADVSEVSAWVDQAVAAHREEQAAWPTETDCDRLDSIFADLGRQGILCLQDAGYTKQDGWGEVARAYAAAGGPASDLVGYCFYHRQDLERVINGSDLFLAFGTVAGNICSGKDDDDTAGVEIGGRVRAALERVGFTVRWDGTLDQRIAVTNLVWRRRRDN